MSKSSRRRQSTPQPAPSGRPMAHPAESTTGRAAGTIAGASTGPGRGATNVLPFAVAIGLSAFLLFSLELLAGRLVLPVFGGTPGVWTTTLCFFTAVLFLGYLFAHVVATRLAPQTGAALQVAIAVVAIVLTVAAPADVASLRVDGLPEALNVIVALAIIAGAAGFLLATTTPLLSSWFSAGGADPWWLYAASNGASFVALLAYPFLVEPLIGLSAQRTVLAVGMAAYGAAIVVIAWTSRRRAAEARTSGRAGTAGAARARTTAAEPSTTTAAPARRRQLLWLAAAFIPAGLLSATTNILQTDLVAAPFIWVGPLAVYLLSFVVAFSERGRRILPIAERLVPAAATILWVPFVHSGGWPIAAIVVVELTSFLILAVAVHGRLALDRPEPAHLTRFYLVVSAGGMLATAFVALIAPLVFNGIFEYPILIVAALAVLALLEGRNGTWLPKLRADWRRALFALAARVLPYALIGDLLATSIGGPLTVGAIGPPLGVGLVAVAIAATPRIAAVTAPFAIVIALILGSPSSNDVKLLLQVRTFFGVIKIEQTDVLHAETSGTTLHGVQLFDQRSKVPTTYYVRYGPLGQVFADLRGRTTGASIGAVGLGTGTLATYAQAGDRLTFYEIDHAVVRIAYDPTYFTFLRDSPVAPLIIEGDARLSLQRAAPGLYDILVLDAFTSDAVPPHLLTREAMLTYERTLRPGGLLVFNVSNRFYDLAGAVAATARTIGLDAVGLDYVPDSKVVESDAATASTWVVVGDQAAMTRFTTAGWVRVGQGGPVMTDDYPDLVRSLRALGH